jgi:plasmid stability protein
MVELKRTTIYFDPGLHMALRLKAAETDQSVSDLVNQAVRRSLAEDAEDLAAFDDKKGGRKLSFEEVVRGLRNGGKI